MRMLSTEWWDRAIAWYLVNRGSKYWQENWENHVDMLENDHVGPLYKTILHRPEQGNIFEKHILGPQAISVSKVNLIVSIFTLCIWVVLLVHSLLAGQHKSPLGWRHFIVGGITLFFIVFARFGAKTHLGSHEHVVTKRKTKIIENQTKAAPDDGL